MFESRCDAANGRHDLVDRMRELLQLLRHDAFDPIRGRTEGIRGLREVSGQSPDRQQRRHVRNGDGNERQHSEDRADLEQRHVRTPYEDERRRDERWWRLLRRDDAPIAGTFAPLRRASDSPIAIACSRLVTFLLLRPLLSVPFLRRRIALLTVSWAARPYRRAMISPVRPLDHVSTGLDGESI